MSMRVSIVCTGNADLAAAMREPELERKDLSAGLIHWLQQLEFAQNVIFCKELFSQVLYL